MPRYYFDVFDGDHIAQDDSGIDFRDEDEAAEQAVAALPEMAHDELQDGPQRDFWVRVRDESGTCIFVADLKFKADWLRTR